MAVWINGTEPKQPKQTASKPKNKKGTQTTTEEPKPELTENA